MITLRRVVHFAILLMIGVVPAVAQDGQCLELWEYQRDHFMRHEVNLDTGMVTSASAIPPSYPDPDSVDSPDGRYHASLSGIALILTDTSRGVRISLAEDVSSLAWSPDGGWLAYLQWDAEQETENLTLYNMDTSEYISADFPGFEMAHPAFAWSPDGRWIAVAAIVNPFFGGTDLLLYSTPDLVLTHTFETTLLLAEIHWSPAGRYFAASSSNGEVALVNPAAGESYILTIGEPPDYRFFWSPGETFVLIWHSDNDHYDEINVMNMQGEVILQDVPVISYQWLNDQQLLANVWTLSGLDDLTLFNLQTGEQRVIQHNVHYYALSPDGRYLAADAPDAIQVFDLSLQPDSPINTVSVEESFNDLIWHADRFELIILFRDRTLRSYNFEADEWRTIATIPGDEHDLQAVMCAQ